MTTETEAILNKSTAMLIDATTLIHFAPRGGRKNLQGEDLTPPEMSMTFSAEMDRFEGKLNKLGHLYKRDGAVRLWLEFTEQLDHGLARKDLTEIDPRPRLTDQLASMPVADQNGHAKTDVVDDTPPRHIGEAIKKRDRAKT